MKKVYFLNSIIIFILAIISHFGYTLLKNDITALFFPVNESIWEHMKLLFTPYLIDYFLFLIFAKKANLVYHNFGLGIIISSIFAIISYLIIYIPKYIIFGHNVIIDIILLYIIILISQFILFYYAKKEGKYSTFFLILITFMTILFGYLTYNPLRNFIFFDKSNNQYGRNIYILGN